MLKKKYNSYKYIDPDNKYTYPKSSTLINKFDERDNKKLQEIEYNLIAHKTLELIAKPIMVMNMKDILKINEFLFGEIYYWAGEYRKVNISKEKHHFIPIQSFAMAENYINSLLDEFHHSASTREQLVKHLAIILDNLNYFHPFREGNGRTQREAIRVLGLSKGYDSEINIDSDEIIYTLYMDGTVNSDISLLERLFDVILEEL